MGACLHKGHKEEQHPMTVLQGQVEDGQLFNGKDDNPSNSNMQDKTSGYDIGQLATSSLLGLVATIKEHITKPTAMAQGRVAHLIEWKGWGGGGEAGGTWTAGWSKGREIWAGMGTDLHQDQQFYSQMTDEIKQARFAAGVAEQFALAEAAMDVWAMNDGLEEPSTSLQATQSQYLSHFLLDVGSVGVPQHLCIVHGQSPNKHSAASLAPLAGSAPQTEATAPSVPISQPHKDGSLAALSGMTADNTMVRNHDSSSLSEDDVFYN